VCLDTVQRGGFLIETDKAIGNILSYKFKSIGEAMQGPLRGLLAGAAAWKFGGGCFSTILIFIIVFWLLGYVNC